MTGGALAGRRGQTVSDARWRVVAALCLLPAVATAAPANTLVAHPLVVVGGSDAEVQRFAALLDAELARRDVRLAPPACSKAFLARRGTGSCGGAEDCLAQLAQACGSARALYVTVYPHRPKLVFTAKVVRADGQVEKVISSFEVTRPAGKPTPEAVRAGLQQLLQVGIQLEALDLAPLVADAPVLPPPPVPAPSVSPPVVVPPPPAAVAAAEVSRAPSGQRIASYVVGGAGVVALGVGTALYFVAKGDESTYQKTLDPAGQRPDTPQAAAQQSSLRSQGPLVTWMLIGGAALVVTGVVLFVTEPSSPTAATARVGAAVGEGGGALLVSGRF
jgi:hypothetical protein